MIAGFVRGQALVSLTLGTFYAAGLVLLGVNFGFLIGLVAGIVSFIPYLGSTLGFVVSVGIALLQFWPDWVMPVATATLFIIGQLLEGYVLQPYLIGTNVGLHPVWLMFALFAFGLLFGFVGLLMAIPLAAAIGVLVRYALARYLASPDLPRTAKAARERRSRPAGDAAHPRLSRTNRRPAAPISSRSRQRRGDRADRGAAGLADARRAARRAGGQRQIPSRLDLVRVPRRGPDRREGAHPRGRRPADRGRRGGGRGHSRRSDRRGRHCSISSTSPASATPRMLITSRDRRRAHCRSTLPDLVSRLRAMRLVTLGAPDDELLRRVLTKLFADRQLDVDPGVIGYIATRDGAVVCRRQPDRRRPRPRRAWPAAEASAASSRPRSSARSPTMRRATSGTAIRGLATIRRPFRVPQQLTSALRDNS